MEDAALTVDKLLVDYKVLLAKYEKLRRQVGLTEPGHFYSPVPSNADLLGNLSRLSDENLQTMLGVYINEGDQLLLLEELIAFYPDMPFTFEATEGMRYYFNNGYYSHSDAIFLYSMIRRNQPKRIIEIGSGFSSFVMLDTNDLFFDGNLKITFIEPYPERLESRLKDSDHATTKIIKLPVQEVDITLFSQLESGDILFVDSSHVSKVGSDVNHIIFHVLPRLAKGVWIHFHDMFYPFEYPKEWTEKGRFWNEDYLMHAFLQYNSDFKIRIWNQYLGKLHPNLLKQTMPLCLKSIGGSLWLQRIN